MGTFLHLHTMPRGPKMHMKSLAAPSHWMLGKQHGIYAPRPSSGPHKLRECIPLLILLRNRLKYALSRREVILIVMQRLVKVDGRVRTDPTYPAGLMDVLSLDKTGENFRILYDEKGRFQAHKIGENQASFKLGKVTRQQLGPKGIPYIVTHDGPTIRYPDPDIRVNDTVKIDLATGKVLDFVKFGVGNIVMCSGGRNMGRVGILHDVESHIGGFNVVHVEDAAGRTFATRLSNVFTLGEGDKSWISLPKRKGIRADIFEDRKLRMKNVRNAKNDDE